VRATRPIPPIELTIRSGAPAELAWRTLTDPERVALWLTDATSLGEPGDPYRLDFGDGSVVAGTITALETGARFAHTWGWEADEPREVTRVEWRIATLPDGGSQITLVHDGWDEAGANVAARDDQESYWSGYLDDLLDVLEEG
jgi:uncharacterized protein YndB with AHSA1/START domain